MTIIAAVAIARMIPPTTTLTVTNTRPAGFLHMQSPFRNWGVQPRESMFGVASV